MEHKSRKAEKYRSKEAGKEDSDRYRYALARKESIL